MSDLFPRIWEAHQALRPQVAVTPLSYSPLLSIETGCEVFLKCEHLQHTGSFKFRGASNVLRKLGNEARQGGVITASTGNHGQGVALAGKLAGVSVTVYASSFASTTKLDAIRALGATVITIDDSTLATELEAARQAKVSGKPFISPYNNIDVIAGQGTVGVELCDQLDSFAAVFTSVGGGGLISGIGTAIHTLRPTARVVGCWPENATSMYASLRAGKIIDVEEYPTISDGTAGGVEPGSVTFPICQNVVDETVLVSEEEIKSAMARLAQTEHWMIEGAAGVALASMFKMAPQYQGQRLVVVLCGRNILLDKFVQAIR